MPTITKIEDFKARYQVAKDAYSKQTLQTYINELETTYIHELLGVELGDLFLADLDINGEPQTGRFITIFEPLAIQDDCGKIHSSYGIKDYLLGRIYFDYVRNTNTYNSQIGNKSAIGENSEIAGNLIHDLCQRYNKGIDNAKAIQWYCCEHDSETYPEYKGVKLDYVHWL